MHLRSCSNLHFITTVKGSKFRNVDSRGRPALKFKNLRDIYESEDAKKVGSHSTSTSQDTHADSAFMSKRVKMERLCIPVVHRQLREVDHASHSDDDESMSDLDDSMTLKQLTERWKTKKRKLTSASVSDSRQGCDKLLPDEDDFDIKETLSSWKLKLSKKKSKVKGKSANKNICKSGLALSVKSEPLLYSEDSMEANRYLMSLFHVKTEDPESEFFESPSPIAFIDDSLSGDDISDGILKTDECDNRQLVLFAGDYPNSSFNDVHCDTPVEDLEVNRCDNCTLFEEECQNCAFNEACYDHLEFLEPTALLPANDEGFEPAIEENSDNQLPRKSSLEISMPAKDQSLKMCSSESTSFLPGISGQTNCISGDSAIDRAVNMKDEIRENLPSTCEVGSLSCPIQSSHSSMHSQLCFSPNDNFVPDEDKTQPFVYKNTDSERSSTASCQTSAGVNASSNSKPLQTPERLPSKRKAISPISQEQLCLAMNSPELHDDADHYRCKEKLSFGKQTEGNASTVSLSFVPVSRDVNSIQSGKLNRAKVMISSNQILKKSKNDKRGSPPKGNLEGPRFSRSLPHVNTGCTSIRSCSESAITFSQRQMHDIESLAVRLVNELKSMKDIVEQKLLFESYRSVSLKGDADEVKTAIENATRVEETARKWLSTMARDCNRFCKIMKLTQNDPAASKNELHGGRKKIRFADEAGGILCHVKFFENGMTSLESPSRKQKDQP